MTNQLVELENMENNDGIVEVIIPQQEQETNATDGLDRVSIPDKKRFLKIIDSILFSRKNVFNSVDFLNVCVIFVVLVGLLWSILFLFTNNGAFPGGVYFSLWILFTFGHIIGFLCRKIKIPALLGMLLVGIICANLSYAKIQNIVLDAQLSSIIRKLALCVILCKAGLSVNQTALQKLKLQVLKLSVVPCLVEAITFSIVAKYILGLPTGWAFLLGFAVTGVSPAVIIPFMYNLQERKLGTDKGIPTLIMASASFDNVIALTGNSVMVGIVFQQGELWWNIVKFPIEIVIGIAFGLVVGFLFNMVRLPHIITVSTLRVLLLGSFAMFVLFGSQKLGFSSIGPLGILCLAFVSKLVWLRVDSKLEGSTESSVHLIEVSKIFNSIWFVIFEPLLFTSIGNEIKFSQLEPKIIGLGCATIIIGIVFRLIATFICTSWTKFNFKEQLFVCFAWLPKATVQAAVGSVALEIALQRNNTESIYYGRIVLQICVLSILLTAPIGALLISLTSKKLLKQETPVI